MSEILRGDVCQSNLEPDKRRTGRRSHVYQGEAKRVVIVTATKFIQRPEWPKLRCLPRSTQEGTATFDDPRRPVGGIFSRAHETPECDKDAHIICTQLLAIPRGSIRKIFGALPAFRVKKMNRHLGVWLSNESDERFLSLFQVILDRISNKQFKVPHGALVWLRNDFGEPTLSIVVSNPRLHERIERDVVACVETRVWSRTGTPPEHVVLSPDTEPVGRPRLVLPHTVRTFELRRSNSRFIRFAQGPFGDSIACISDGVMRQIRTAVLNYLGVA